MGRLRLGVRDCALTTALSRLREREEREAGRVGVACREAVRMQSDPAVG